MVPLALSASASFLIPSARVSMGAGRWERMMPMSMRLRYRLGWYTNPRRKKGLRFVASRALGSDGGMVGEISEGEKGSRVFGWPDSKKPRVCILGGGFGGLYTALRLESLLWDDDKKPQVLLIDQSEHFVFKPLLYELLSGEVDAWEIAPRFSDLLANTGVQFFKDRVKLLRPSDHLGVNNSLKSGRSGTVLLESGLLIEYDWLVVALGAEAKLDIIPGAAEFAFPFTTLEDACKVNDKLKDLERRRFGKDAVIQVAVVGCGYSGVELAATISERLQDRGIVQAINVETTILPTAPPGNREAALKVLRSRNVQLLLGYFVRCIRRVIDSEGSAISSGTEAIQDISENCSSERYILELQPAERGLDNQILEADIVLFTVGSKPQLPQLEPFDDFYGLPLNARGQAETDETLRVKGHPRIFALGDSSALRDSAGRLLPATAQVAFQQADFTGWNLWAAINDRPLLPFKLSYADLLYQVLQGGNSYKRFPVVESCSCHGYIVASGQAEKKDNTKFSVTSEKYRLQRKSWEVERNAYVVGYFASNPHLIY